MRHRALRLPLSTAVAGVTALVLTSVGASAEPSPQPVDDETLQTATVSFGGADPLQTDRTVQHWADNADNPNGITYRYNMVGVNPSTDGSATIGVDIIPLDVNVDGMSFNGSERVDGVVASPLFQANDYSTTKYATRIVLVQDPHGKLIEVCCVRKGSGADYPLSAGNSGQLIDATMRSEFNKIGTDYHLLLDTPVVYDPVTIDVPADKGIVAVSPVGV